LSEMRSTSEPYDMSEVPGRAQSRPAPAETGRSILSLISIQFRTCTLSLSSSDNVLYSSTVQFMQSHAQVTNYLAALNLGLL